jgi:hypothetical protein
VKHIAVAIIVVVASISSVDAFANEQARIREHLQDVEAHLRARDVSDWPSHLQEARRDRLDDLRAYREAGVFPRNLDFPESRVPYFIDDRGSRARWRSSSSPPAVAMWPKKSRGTRTTPTSPRCRRRACMSGSPAAG